MDEREPDDVDPEPDPGIDPPVDAARAADRAHDAHLVLQVRGGDPDAFGQLYDRWFDRVYDLVLRIVRNPDVAAEVAQDAFLSAWRSLPSLQNVDAFGGWLLRIARNGAYNRSQREARSSAVDDQGLAMIESAGASPVGAPAGFGVEDRLGRAATPDAALEDREVVSLVWQAAAALPERDVEVLDLQLRHGLTPAEIGEVLGMNRNAANQLVHRLRGRLESAIRARVLWRSGQPSCAVLAARLREAGVTMFGAEAVRVIERHIPGCADCEERQRMRLQPNALFAAVPVVIAPQLIKTQSAAALEAAGVPMQGSAFSSSALGASSLGSTGAGSTGSGSTGSGSSGGTGARSAATAATVIQPAVRPASGAAGASRRGTWAAFAAAAAVIVLVGALLIVTRGGDESPSTLAASGTTATTVASSTTTRGTAPATSQPVVTATSQVPASSTTPSASTTPGVSTTVAPTTPGTTAKPTTTTAPKVDATLTIDPTTEPTQWPLVSLRAGVPATLTWAVKSEAKVTVAVEGPEGTAAKTLLGTNLAGTYAVCPGTRSTDKVPTCTATPGAYVYLLTVYGPTGAVLVSRQVTLTVTPPPIS